MQERIKRSVISATLMGLVPTFSLLYVCKEGLAVILMFVYVCSAFAIGFTDIAIFSTSFLIFISIQILLFLISLVLGIYYASKGVEKANLEQDRGLYLTAYILLVLGYIILLNDAPVDFYSIKSNMQNNEKVIFEEGDVLVTQKKPNLNALVSDEYIIYLDENYEQAFGQIVAMPNDVLSNTDGVVLRNDKTMNIQLSMPFKNWIVPENHILIMRPSQVDLGQPSQTLDPTLALLPIERTKAKAIFILFSKNLKQIGVNLTPLVLPSKEIQ